jgi:hypothetical protein
VPCGLGSGVNWGGLVAANGHGQAAHTAEENQGCGIHRILPASAQRFLTTFLVFYRQRDSSGRISPAQEQVPKQGGTSMAAKQKGEPSVPAAAKPAYDSIVGLTDRFCKARLTWEYQMLCRKLTATLARKRPSPLTRGKPEVWACAVLRVVGWVNFLDDSSGTPYMKLTVIDKAFGVAESTGQGKAKAIRNLLKIRQFDFHWMLRQHIEASPMAWLIEVNGFMVDARHLRREVQEEAFRKGLIPYVPADRHLCQE